MSKGRSNDAKPGGYDIFIRNVHDTTVPELAEYFGSAGTIIREPRLNPSRGFAWITFDTMEAVKQACSWSGSYFGSRILYVHAANNVDNADAGGLKGRARDEGQDTHYPALCEETIRKLVAPDAGGVYVDGTFGRGGHTRAMLAALSPAGRLHGFDMDPEAIAVGEELMRQDPRFTIHHAPFSTMRACLRKAGVAPGSVAGVLLDVGISSPQFDDVSRGFRPEADGPLDLRFDTAHGVPASEFLRTVPHAELVRIISEYGEEAGGGHVARRIADVVCLARARGALPTTTKAFAELVARAKGKETSGQLMHPAKMTFQALRIHLNDEFGEMRKGMRAAFKVVGDGGRIGLITWKFSERKIVDEVFGALQAVREHEPLLEWYRAQPTQRSPLPDGPSLESDEVVRPSERELQKNSRSRSALLHVLHKRNLPRLAHLEKRAYKLPGWAEVVAPAQAAEAPTKRVSGKRKAVGS